MMTTLTGAVTSVATQATGSEAVVAAAEGPVPTLGAGAAGVFTRVQGVGDVAYLGPASGELQIVVQPSPVADVVGAYAVFGMLFLLMLREVLVAFIAQESLNPHRRGLLVRLQALLVGVRAPIGALLAVFVALFMTATLKFYGKA